jgi:uncharacterized protein (TIGR03435 family)
MKLCSLACASLTVFCVSLLAQAPVTPAFEVASIKPAPPIQTLVAQIQSGKLRAGMTVDGARVDIPFISITNLILAAYKVKPYQIASPDWLKSQMYEIHAKLPEGSNKDQVPEMLQALLAERFKLAFHRETRDLPVYAQLVSKNGRKLKEAVEEAPAPAPGGDSAITPAKENTGKQLGSINTAAGR